MAERFSPPSRGYRSSVEGGLPSDDSVTTRADPSPQTLALVVTLRSGERFVAGPPVDGETAKTRLQRVQSDLAAERFVRIGDEVVLRADEVRAVELTDERELAARAWQADRDPQAGYGGEPADEWARPPARDWTPLARVERALLERVGFFPTAELVALVGRCRRCARRGARERRSRCGRRVARRRAAPGGLHRQPRHRQSRHGRPQAVVTQVSDFETISNTRVYSSSTLDAPTIRSSPPVEADEKLALAVVVGRASRAPCRPRPPRRQALPSSSSSPRQ